MSLLKSKKVNWTGTKEAKEKWLRNNPEKRKEVALAYYYRNRKKSREYELKRKYNITLEDYEKMVFNQNGLCAICHKPPLTHNKILRVDHDHIKGEVRALLCDNCNSGLGMFHDDTEVLKNAINYLEKFK